MKLIVGLGNPGKIYINSRHNIGFSVIKVLARQLSVPFDKDARSLSLVGRDRIRNKNILMAMPLTFMNLSGITVSALVKKYKIDLSDLLVVCDDLDLGLGRLKIRPRGSSGGHRGLQSIIENLKSDQFARLRIGIGRPHPDMETAEFVLSAFTREEKEVLENTLVSACDCCCSWIVEGITKSMNAFNRKNKRQ